MFNTIITDKKTGEEKVLDIFKTEAEALKECEEWGGTYDDGERSYWIGYEEAHNLNEFASLTAEQLESAGTNDYNEAVEILESNGHVIIEKNLADCCEVYRNNAETDAEAIGAIRNDYINGGRVYPLANYEIKEQIIIFTQWLAQF